MFELFTISQKFVSKDTFDNISQLFHVMAWRRTGNKPLPEPILTQFTEDRMRQHGEMSWKVAPKRKFVT